MIKLRTFIAHPVPEEWKNILAESTRTLRKGLKSRIAWVKPENMHLTLKFIGDVPEDNIQELHENLSRVPFRAFDISTGKAGFFPAPKEPRIIWLGLSEGANEFCRIAKEIDHSLAKLDFPKNRKSCHAHLTLGRVKELADDNWYDLADRINNIELPAATVNEFILYKSVLTPSGPVYSELRRYGPS